jgi:hypothetical protein
MFLKTSILKKIMKNAYTGAGLCVCNENGNIILQGNSWMVMFPDGVIPKEMKGEIIKFIGDFPPKGEGFRITKDGEQMALDVSDGQLFELDKKDDCVVTTITIDTSEGQCSLIENSSTKEKFLINSAYTDIVDLDSLEETDEFPEGPYVPEGMSYALIWQTSEIKYMAAMKDFSANERVSRLLDALKGVDCNVRM